MTKPKARVYFRTGRIAMIHNLENPCAAGLYIAKGNYEDFATYDEAVSEIFKRRKTPQHCKLCERKGEWKKQ